MYLKIVYCILVIIYIKTIDAGDRCKCDKLTVHYDNFGCKPIYEKDEDCCPSRYDCGEVFEKISNDTSCFFKGKVYDIREEIDTEVTQSSCLAACFCSKREDEDFTCAHIDCPEFLGYRPPKVDCIQQYDLNSCCLKKYLCPPFDKVPTCKIGNETYYEGQKFDNPSNPCEECVCKEGFEGKFVKPFCEEIPCNAPLKSMEFREFCAPFYSQHNKCCPYFWKCQDEDDTKRNANNETIDTDLTTACRFGNKTVKLREKIIVDQAVCKCEIPPLVTCE